MECFLVRGGEEEEGKTAKKEGEQGNGAGSWHALDSAERLLRGLALLAVASQAWSPLLPLSSLLALSFMHTDLCTGFFLCSSALSADSHLTHSLFPPEVTSW